MPMINPYQHVRLCIWAGVVLLFIEVVFWGILGQNIPPYSPALDAQAYAEVFRADADVIRIGMTGAVMGGILYMFWTVGITKIMEPIERANSANNVLSTLQMWSGGLTTVFFIVPPGIWLGSTFRAQTMPPDILQALTDVAWMLFDMSATTGSAQLIALGVCILSDRRRIPIIPKWIGWMGIYVGASLVMFAFMPFFKTGAFARNGAINFWFELPAFFLFMVLSTIFLLKAIPKLDAEYAAEHVAKT
ncbi:hypothetical protein DFR24_2216 [Panacagrimonas perspica]|uniref:Uncharacterized protein n=2 Tax=Panacagrimonas perspica TaxID=381431 RepID=A0A4R7PGL8_9GAMM|nr:hypothetical protein DFR24_2216 [Panacagrimonas perspica]THD00926.1 hypothetical protein B1810_21940 [Panacagrimonas perspica]